MHLVAALGAEPIKLVGSLYPFRGRGDIEATPEARDRAPNGNTVRSFREILYKRAIDLDLVEWKAAQVAQALIAGAEIVQRYGNAEFAQLMQHRYTGLGLCQEHRVISAFLPPEADGSKCTT